MEMMMTVAMSMLTVPYVSTKVGRVLMVVLVMMVVSIMMM